MQLLLLQHHKLKELDLVNTNSQISEGQCQSMLIQILPSLALPITIGPKSKPELKNTHSQILEDQCQSMPIQIQHSLPSPIMTGPNCKLMPTLPLNKENQSILNQISEAQCQSMHTQIPLSPASPIMTGLRCKPVLRNTHNQTLEAQCQ